ncbi:MAG: beta-ketoacyl synthase N-terminal-like domain-containing protein, partial [Myxococcota bacterium]
QALGQPLDGDALDAWTTALSDAVTPPLTANRTMGRLGEITASRVAREFGLGGPSYTVSGEECSGLVGLDVAVRALQRGDLDRALVGAVDLPGEFRAQLASGLVRPTSAEGQARPFDRAASGTVYGDGAVAMVLKRLEDAERDGDSVYAVVRGIGLATGGEATALAPTAEAQAQSMERALADAAVDAATIGLVEAHGSAVPMEDQTEAQALTRVWGGQEGAAPVLGSVKADVGHTGAAAGLVSAVKACLCLDQAIVPPLRGVGRLQRGLDTFVHPTKPRYWLYNSAQAPRRALVTAQSTSGLAASVVLEAAPSPQPPQGEEHRPTPKHPPTQGHLAAKAHHAAEEHPHHALGQAPGPRPVAEHGPPTQGRLAVRTARRPLGPGPEQLFVFEAETPHGLMAQLDRLAALVEEGHPPRSAAEWAQQWWAKTGRQEEATLGLALVAENHSALKRRLVQARHAVATGVDPGGWVRYSPRPLGREGELAFVFPGSGSQFAGMGRSMGVEWPAVLDAQQDRVGRLRDQLLPEVIWDATAITDRARDLILAQVSLGTLVSDLVRSFGVQPQAVVGYSLGETAGLFALGAWSERDMMLERALATDLFTTQLTGPCLAARQAWGLASDAPPVEWRIGVVDRPEAAVRRALADEKRAYLLIVNTPDACVVGGESQAVERTVARLGADWTPLHGVTTVHCPVVEPVAEAYRDLHLLPTQPVEGVRFYSGAWAEPYTVTRERAADAILAQALEGVHFPRTVERAWNDGVRVFLELGPGRSCTRMIEAILAERPVATAAACVEGQSGRGAILSALAMLVAQRVPVRLDDLMQTGLPQPSATATRAMTLPVGGQPIGPWVPPERYAAPTPQADTVPTATLSRPVARPPASSTAKPGATTPENPVRPKATPSRWTVPLGMPPAIGGGGAHAAQRSVASGASSLPYSSPSFSSPSLPLRPSMAKPSDHVSPPSPPLPGGASASSRATAEGSPAAVLPADRLPLHLHPGRAWAALGEERAQAHAAFLKQADRTRQIAAQHLAFQMELVTQAAQGGVSAAAVAPVEPPGWPGTSSATLAEVFSGGDDAGRPGVLESLGAGEEVAVEVEEVLPSPVH